MLIQFFIDEGGVTNRSYSSPLRMAGRESERKKKKRDEVSEPRMLSGLHCQERSTSFISNFKAVLILFLFIYEEERYNFWCVY